MRTVFAFCCLAILTSACQAQPETSTLEAVTAKVETTPTVQDGANDPAIWFNAKDPAKSLVLGAASEGGLEVYSLSGDRISSVSGRPVALVDVLHNFSLGGKATDLAVAYDPTQSELMVFAIDGVSGELSDINAGTLPTEGELEGMCTYQSPFSLKFYVFGLTDGLLKQWELIDQNGRVAGRLIALAHEHGQKVEEGMLIDIKVSQNDFARLAMGSRQRVNRIFRDWDKRGLVEMRGDFLLIKNFELFEQELAPFE